MEENKEYLTIKEANLWTTNYLGKEVQKNYVADISNVLNNCRKYLKNNYNVFLVANNKYNLYSSIAEKSKIQIVNTFDKKEKTKEESIKFE
ncbi:MAG: hypothetical protein LBT07_02455, partial [Endomicrobium sp.]|nr:hypothetical protein [Endomicrobium sp.]